MSVRELETADVREWLDAQKELRLMDGRIIRIGTEIALIPSRGADGNCYAIVRDVDYRKMSVKVDAYRGTRRLPRDSGWYRLGEGLYAYPGHAPYLAGYDPMAPAQNAQAKEQQP